MKVASNSSASLPRAEHTIDISPQVAEQNHTRHSSPSTGALVSTKGTFSSFLAPLNKESFKEVVTGVEDKLKVVNQTLSMLTEVTDTGFEMILREMLESISYKTGELLSADRTTIYLRDEDEDELVSIVAKGEGGQNLEFRVPIGQGIAGQVAQQKQLINIPYDFYDDPRSASAKAFDKKNGYRTYTMLVLPLLNEEQELVAVVQLINKLKSQHHDGTTLAEQICQQGFTDRDIQLFQEFAPSIRLLLQSSRSFYRATQRQRAANALMEAINSLSKSNLDLDATLSTVMNAAKQLMEADKSTIWLIDRESNDLWAKLPQADGSLKEMRVPIGIGFAGKVAATGNPLNIGFDLYNHQDSENSKKFDQKTGYRTCSLLCMPVFNSDGDLIGVTQLLNKTKQGDLPPYDPQHWPEAPQRWKASFNRSDQEFMKAFNIQAGVALQNAQLFAQVKQQEQMQRDILRSLTNGVISTDKLGKVIAANEKAKNLLGLPEDEVIEGYEIAQLITIKEGNFSEWFQSALQPSGEQQNREQYYPDQTLISQPEQEEHSVNLSINSITDANDSTNVYGALVVMDDISDEKRLKSTMYRYMTQELAEKLLQSGEARLGGDRKEVSVLFSDIRSYTTITEKLAAEEVVKMLNDYFETMVEAIFEHKGTLDKYIGDAIMAVFGSPLPLENHAWNAVQTALDMRRRLQEFNLSRTQEGQQEIKIGIGIHSDSVISGNIGSSKRMEFTAIGDGVNLGSRLEGASKQYGCDIIISENTYRPCADEVIVRELDRTRVKGKTQPVSMYELVAYKSDTLPLAKQDTIELYHQGREYYLNQNFARAIAQFSMVMDINSQDKASKLHIERCQHFINNPPPKDWDGVWTLTSK